MKHFRFGDKIETSLNLFLFIYFQGSESSRFAFGCHENSDPGKQIKKNRRFKLVSILLSKMFYGHRRQQPESAPERIEMFILSGLSLSRPVNTKTEFNLNNIIATPSLISISSVKKFAGKCPQTWSQLRSMNAKAGKHRHSELYGLDVTISACYDSSVPRQLTSFPLRHWNLRNLTLQQECYLTSTRAFSVLSHGSIMLPPRQPRVFARLARWQ